MNSMLLECLDIDADASVVIVLDTLANTHRSLGTRPRLDYTHRVMLNDFVSARWSPMYQYLALTSLRDGHPLPTRHIREPGTDRRLFFSLPYFRTSVSVLRFPYFGFRTSAFSTCP